MGRVWRNLTNTSSGRSLRILRMEGRYCNKLMSYELVVLEIKEDLVYVGEGLDSLLGELSHSPRRSLATLIRKLTGNLPMTPSPIIRSTSGLSLNILAMNSNEI